MTRIEQCQLGTVFVCSFGSPRHGPGGCRRTYLSYRDMEAHVKHRHAKKETPHPSGITPQQPLPAMSQPPPNLTNPPPQFMRPPNPNFPPPGHMVNRPPPNMAQSPNVPPPRLPVVSHPLPVHHVPPNAVSMQGSIPSLAAAPRPSPANPVVMQRAPGMPLNSMHQMRASHGMPHQQMPPGNQAAVPRNPVQHNPVHNNAVHSNPVHTQRMIRPLPQPGAIRPHNPPPSSSNLISIPLQGGTRHDQNNFNNWQSGGPQQSQQQWQNNSRVHSNITHPQYNS